MNLLRVLESCERRAAAQWPGWADFAPVGLLVSPSGDVRALGGYVGTTTASEVAEMLLREARHVRGGVEAVGMVCSAWASVQAPQQLTDPSAMPDRRRARVVYAADRQMWLHVYSQVQGKPSHYEQQPQFAGGVPGLLADVMRRLAIESGDVAPGCDHGAVVPRAARRGRLLA